MTAKFGFLFTKLNLSFGLEIVFKNLTKDQKKLNLSFGLEIVFKNLTKDQKRFLVEKMRRNVLNCLSTTNTETMQKSMI